MCDGPGVEKFTEWAEDQRRRGISDRTIRIRLQQVMDVYESAGGDGVGLTVWHVRRFCEGRGHSQGTLYLYAVAVRDYERFRNDNPDQWKGVRMPRQPKGRPKPLTDDEVDRLFARVPKWSPAYPYIRFALYGGLRAKEIAGLRHEDVDRTRDEITIRGKQEIVETIPLHPELIQFFDEDDRKRGSLFPGVTGNSVSTIVGYHMRRAGIQGRIHRLRHTYATRIYRATGDIYITSKALRHQSLVQTSVYAELDDNRLRHAIAGV